MAYIQVSIREFKRVVLKLQFPPKQKIKTNDETVNV